MAIIKKYGETLTQTLSSFATFVKDIAPNSTYFKITEFNDTFTGGKNGFLIEGSEYLKESTEIKIQILDVNGDPIYFEPGNGIPEYYEGTSKVIAVYIYEDTPIGVGKITILGELKTYLDEGNVVRDIPEEWKNVYNVKWERDFKINRLLSNEDKVRFYRRPKVSINEIVKPIFNNVTTTIIQTGSLSGIAQSPQIGQPLLNYTAPTSYILSIDDNTNWTGSVVGTFIEVPSLNYRTLADSVINKKTLLVNTPYTNTSLGSIAPVENFSNEGYTASFNYVEGVNNLKTALTGSFAKITLSDLTTFVGDVARVKIFRKSQSDLADYQFVQEIRLESNEILRDLESQTKNEEFYGIFDNVNYKNYWVTSSNNLSTTFDQNYLFNSLKLNSTGVNNFFTTSSVSISENIEYTLNLNVRVENGQVSAEKYIRAFLSGSKQSSLNGNPITVQIEQDIVTITSDNSLLQKNQITANFKGEQSENTKLYFEVKGTGWYLSDISLRASQETAYSPDEITFIQSVPRTLPEETFLYRFEFYDINNNYIPVLVEASKTFDGGNLQKLQKGLVFTPRSLQFQFDSGSNPVPPTVVGFTVTKNLLTGSVTYTSESFDFDGNELFDVDYSAYITNGGGFPGLLDGITSDAPTMTVQHFTGSRIDKTIQIVKITGEVEGFTDTVIFSRVLDGFGGVNHLIRPYRGTQIRNSSTASLEIQAIRIDGVNDIEIGSTTKPEKGWPDKQLHVLSASLNPLTEPEKFINLALASSSGYVKGLTTGSLGSREINYNATFNRDSIDTRRTIYLMSSGSAASGPAYIASASVVASIILEDLQDGLDTPVVKFNTDVFNINPRTEGVFRPNFAYATASFYKRGTIEEITASFQVFPSMSINEDWVPEYWLYYTTQSVDSTISVSAIDEAKRIIPSRPVAAYTSLPTSQSKNLTLTFTYTEPYTSASIAIDKTFTIVPQGDPGDETIVFEITPINVTLAANSRGFVNDYKPSLTEIKVKQGSRYLAFTGSVSKDKFSSHGTFHIAQASITASNITGGLVYFDNNYTESLIVSASSGFVNLSGSVTYPLIIHPYYTSSIYTQSIVQQYTKVLDGPPPIQINITPLNANITSDEVGFVSASNYAAAFTNITVREGDDFLTFTTQSTAAGTWRIKSIETRNSMGEWNIRTGSLSSSSLNTATLDFNRFDFPYVSASALYEIQVYPYALGPGHEYTSSIYFRNQSFTKNVSPVKARSVNLSATSTTVNFNGDGVQVSPEGSIYLNATPIGVTGSAYYQFFKDSVAYSGVSQDPQFEIPSGDATGPGQIAVWKVELRDGNPSGVVRAASEITIAGIKAGQDAYQSFVSNQNTSIAASLWETSFSGSGAIVNASKEGVPLIHTSSYNGLPISYEIDGVTEIGVLGYYSASILLKSNFISINSQSRLLGSPASINDLTFWYKPAVNQSAEVIYKIDFEDGRATHFHTQSINVNFTPPAPYVVTGTNENASITADLWSSSLNNTANTIRVFRGDYELTNINPLPGGDMDAYGVAGLSKEKAKVSIQSFPSSYLTLGGGLTNGSFVTGTPATIPNLSNWSAPAVNNSATVVYKIECEGRQTLYQSQSLSVQFTPPAPYVANLSSENGGITYRVSGELEFDLSTTTIRVYRGDLELTNVSTFSSGQNDAYGNFGYPNQCRVSILAYSGHITLAGGLTAGSHITGTPAVFAGISGWNSPETISSGEIVFQIDCEGRETIYKTLSLSVVYEGNTGPGIVMRGIWSSTLDYIAEIANQRRDAVIWPDPATVNKETHYWAAITGSGPGTPVGAQQPDGTSPYNDTSYWQYLGQEEFFVSAKIAIFEESYVKNTLNVGTKDGTGAFANIVLAGGRTDPYIAIGQTGTQGTSGTGASVTGPGVIGYNRPGIFMGVYEDGTNGTTGRFSIKTTGTSGKGMFWDGDQLTIVGSIRQRQPGIPEGSYRGIWASGVTYYPDDTVLYASSTWINSNTHTSTNDTNVNTGFPPNATNTWAVSAAAGTSGTGGTSGQSGTSGLSGTNGTAGGPGPGVVYRGLYVSTTKYYYDQAAGRRDIVQFGSTYYIAKNAAKNDTATWGQPNTTPADWETFGAQFSSVATDVLFAVEQYVDKTINIGAKGENALIVLNANESGSNANPYLSIGQISSSIGPGSIVTESQAQGFNNNGIFLGFDEGVPKVSLIAASGSLIWDGEDLSIRGTINSNDGVIGGWQIGEGSIISSNQNIRLFSEPSESIILFDDSGSLRFFANTQLSLPDPTGVSYASATIPTFSTSSLQTNGVPNDGTYSAYYGGTIAYDYYITPSANGSFTAANSGPHIITYNLPANSNYVLATGAADGFISLRLVLTKTGYAPQSYTEFVANSNAGSANAQGSVNQNYFWNGFQYEVNYYPSSQQMYIPATKLTMVADLQSGVTYYITLVGYAYLHSSDTSDPIDYPPYGFDSEVETTLSAASAGSVTIKTISAGTTINGGGFQSVLADDKYLRVRDGISGSYNFSTEITGSLMVDRAISKFSQNYGYPAAVKAFCRITYNGTDASQVANYTVSRRYNISSTLSMPGFNQYSLTFLDAMDANDYLVFVQPSNLTYSTNESALIPMITSNSTTGFSFRVEKPDEANPGMQTVYIGANTATVSQATEYANVIVVGR